jgi:class 3 adenylate cyclase
VIFEHGGTLDKFIGDAADGAVGRAAGPGEQPAPRTRRCAGDATRGGHAQRPLAPAGRPEIGVGIGINHGEVFVGISGVCGGSSTR